MNIAKIEEHVGDAWIGLPKCLFPNGQGAFEEGDGILGASQPFIDDREIVQGLGHLDVRFAKQLFSYCQGTFMERERFLIAALFFIVGRKIIQARCNG